MQTPEQILDEIRELASKLGWELALNPSKDIDGIILGDIEFITNVLNGDINPEDFGIFASGVENEELH